MDDSDVLRHHQHLALAFAASGSGIFSTVNVNILNLHKGGLAEDRVLQLLLSRRWQLVERNWRCRWGEFDLLLIKPGRLLLVEVKARRQAGFDAWGASKLDSRKRLRLGRTFACWLSLHSTYQTYPVQMVLALVRLPVSTLQVRWIPVLEASVSNKAG